MFEKNAFEIMDENGNTIVVVSHLDRNLTEKEMNKLMEMFNGKQNCKCAWIFQDNSEALNDKELENEYITFLENC